MQGPPPWSPDGHHHSHPPQPGQASLPPHPPPLYPVAPFRGTPPQSAWAAAQRVRLIVGAFALGVLLIAAVAIGAVRGRGGASAERGGTVTLGSSGTLSYGAGIRPEGWKEWNVKPPLVRFARSPLAAPSSGNLRGGTPCAATRRVRPSPCKEPGVPHDPRSPMAARLLSLLLVAGLAGAVVGCDGGGASSRASTSAPATPIVEGELPADPDPAAITSFHALLLEREVGLDRAAAAQAAGLIAARFAAAQDEVAQRVEALLPVDDEAIHAVLLRHQRALDQELAALMTPAQRDRFAELGGRLEAADARD